MPRTRTLRGTLALATFLAASPLFAQSVTLTDPSSITKAISPDGAAIVKLKPLTSIGAASFSTLLAHASYPNPPWAFNTTGTLGGTLNVTNYDAGWKGGSASGGATISATYDRGAPVPAGQQMQWIQVISTNIPLGGATSPYIDPQPNDDALPFYWTSAELPTYTSGQTLSFYDFSTRAAASLGTTDPINWSANLFLVDWDGATTVNVHDGLTWGWEMASATAGTSTAAFSNPGPTCPPATCTGLGTAAFTWGNGTPPSGLTFTPSHFNPTPGDVFKLGSLDFYNGANQEGSTVDNVDLDFSILFDNNPDANHVLHSSLSLINTLNSDDPFASADYVSFTSGGFSSNFHVFENMGASADLFARIIATSRVVGDKSLDSPDPFEEVSYGFQLVEIRPTSGGGFVTSPVPEPGTVILVASGLAGVLWYHRRRDRRAARRDAGRGT